MDQSQRQHRRLNHSRLSDLTFASGMQQLCVLRVCLALNRSRKLTFCIFACCIALKTSDISQATATSKSMSAPWKVLWTYRCIQHVAWADRICNDSRPDLQLWSQQIDPHITFSCRVGRQDM